MAQQKELSQEEVQQLAEKMKELHALEGVSVELCGSWLWIKGNTKEVKEALKTLGCHYAPKKKEWYYHTGTYHKFSRRTLSKEEIEERYGSQKIF